MKEKIAKSFEKMLLEATESKGYILASWRGLGKMTLKADDSETGEQIEGDVFYIASKQFDNHSDKETLVLLSADDARLLANSIYVELYKIEEKRKGATVLE